MTRDDWDGRHLRAAAQHLGCAVAELVAALGVLAELRDEDPIHAVEDLVREAARVTGEAREILNPLVPAFDEPEPEAQF